MNIIKKVGSRRLIAARDATIEEYPYVVSIQKYNEHWCAGALLNQRLVITTANCIWKSNHISRMLVRAGSRYYDRGGQTAGIQEVAKHPLWNIRSPPDNDIGLILLDRFIKFSASVHSVDLPNKAMMPAFEDAWVTSWGSDRRDTGAPAVSDGIVWGLASWGIRKLCGTERFPAMFTYVASTSNIDFITNATHYLMSEERFNPYPDRFGIYNQPQTTTESTIMSE